VRRSIELVPAHQSSVLIMGPSGTGKELSARPLHACSTRSAKPLGPVACAVTTGTLFATHMFGHVKGSFTGATSSTLGCFRADQAGTIFLDEIGDLPLTMQSKLLRAIQEGEVQRIGSTAARKVDVRILAASCEDLEQAIRNRSFREDLYYRLNVVRIVMPPLRDRRGDIPLLAQHFLNKVSADMDVSPTGFSDAAMDLLINYDWPGNVRELSHSVERALLMASGDLIQPADLGLQASREGGASLDDMSLDEVERYLIKRTLARCDGSALEAARALGLSRSAFYRRLEKYGL